MPPGHIGREEDAPAEAQHIVVDQTEDEGQKNPGGAGPLVPPQNQAAEEKQQVVPDQVHQHLPGVQVVKHIVAV